MPLLVGNQGRVPVERLGEVAPDARRLCARHTGLFFQLPCPSRHRHAKSNGPPGEPHAVQLPFAPLRPVEHSELPLDLLVHLEQQRDQFYVVNSVEAPIRSRAHDFPPGELRPVVGEDAVFGAPEVEQGIFFQIARLQQWSQALVGLRVFFLILMPLLDRLAYLLDVRRHLFRPAFLHPLGAVRVGVALQREGGQRLRGGEEHFGRLPLPRNGLFRTDFSPYSRPDDVSRLVAVNLVSRLQEFLLQSEEHLLQPGLHLLQGEDGLVHDGKAQRGKGRMALRIAHLEGKRGLPAGQIGVLVGLDFN